MRQPPDLEQALDLSKLKGKSVLVTGGASGIGTLVATTFSEQGARVTVADINEKQGIALAQAAELKGFPINFIATDVSSWTSQVEAFKSAIVFSGSSSVDIVVAAAGLAGPEFISPEEESPSLERDPPEPRLAGPTLDVNAKGVYFTSKLAQYYFALPCPSSDTASGTPRKCLIIIGSLAGYLALDAAAYTASKWAVRGLFRSIRSKMEDLGYRVNLIAPWVMDTPMSRGLAAICREQGFPVGDAQRVADAVVRCAADDSIYGRALGIGAAETFDLRDDADGMDGAVVMQNYLEGEVKGFTGFFGHRP